MCIERALGKTTDGTEDLVSRFRPFEWLWVLVMSVEILLYRISELQAACVRASPQGMFREQAEEAFSEIKPRGMGGCEVKMESRALGQPAFDHGCLVRRKIVEHNVDVQIARDDLFDLSKELLELYRSVAPVTLPEDFTRCRIERSKKIRGSMTNVVMGLALRLAQAHGQDRLRTLKRLNLRLFVDADNERVIRGIHVQADNVPDLFDELRVLRQTERFRTVRLKPERAPNPADGGMTQSKMRGHRARAPMGPSRRSRLQRLDHDLLDLVVCNRTRHSRPWLVIQPLQPLFDEATTPLSHCTPRGPQLLRNIHIRQSRRAMQHDLCPERLVRRRAPASTQSLKRVALFRRQFQLGFSATFVFHALRRSQQSTPCLAIFGPGD